MRDQNSRFNQFTEECLQLSPRRYRRVSELRKHSPDYDVYICGSDQIWNPSKQNGLDPACFLDFGPDSIRRVSYAASFGGSAIDKRYHNELSRYLSGLDCISIREGSGRDLVKQFSGRDCHIVPDPTFLVDLDDLTQRSGATSVCSGKIFSYVLRSGQGLYDFQRELSESLKLGLVQPLNPHQRWKSYGDVVPMSPFEWLRAIRESSAVITNSFHGTVFAILANRPFLSVRLSGAKSFLNERMEYLINSLGLETRQISLDQVENGAGLMQEPIDWDLVNSRISKMRKNGVAFLEAALSCKPS